MSLSILATLGIRREHASNPSYMWYLSRSRSRVASLRYSAVYRNDYITVRFTKTFTSTSISRKGTSWFGALVDYLQTRFAIQNKLTIGHSTSITYASHRPFNTLAPALASIQTNRNVPYVNVLSSPKSKRKPPPISKIRHHLRLWEAVNVAPPISNADGKEMSQFVELSGTPTGLWNRPNFEDINDTEDYDDSVYSTFDNGELVDFGDQRSELTAGDLVERRDPGGLDVEVAIYIRTLGSRAQFYTMSGKLTHGKAKAPKFFIPRFVDPEEIAPLNPFLPNEKVVRINEGKFQTLEEVVPRAVGSPLVEKLLLFWRESDSAYRATASKLDNAHALVAQQTTVRYATLLELAEELLPSSMRKNGNFPTSVLYALHRCLMQDDVGFQAQRLGTHRTWGRFEICSIDEVKMIDAVSEDVRRYQESLASATTETNIRSNPDFLSFIKTARNLVRESRQTRDYTSHGMIGPIGHRNNTDEGQAEIDVAVRSGHLQNYFSEKHRPYIRFMELWAGSERFGSRSRLNGIASAILRATGMYKDDLLKRSVGWTFLQEIGVIPPWENPLPHVLRSGRPGQVLRPERENTHWDQPADTMQHLRRDWGSLPVYCIDDAGAVEIDDGISVEPADAPEEYWVHIHTADPASGIVPRGDIAQGAEALIRSMYLPEQVTSMLPSSLVQQRFSLAPDRPSLTFSARLNINGYLLEYKITPGIVRKVLYMTPATFSSMIGQQQPTDHVFTITVGEKGVNGPQSHGKMRQLLGKCDFSESDIRNLKLLHRLGNARLRSSFEKGASANIFPSLEVSVFSSSDDMWRRHAESTCIRYQQDPAIQVSAGAWDLKTFVTSASTVMSMMLLTGEIAARWCKERSVPVINRVTQLKPGNIDPREYFHRMIWPSTEFINVGIPGGQEPNGMAQFLKEYGTKTSSLYQAGGECKTLLELQEAMQSVPLPIMSQYKRLLGCVLPSTTPGPHVALGLDMFTRVTSPLRRYSDLVVHWQIEAALLEEARLGASLIGSERDDYLPFKKHELDELIPRLENRERLLTSTERGSRLVWTLQLLLRAWKFNQASIPAAFEVVARDINAKSIKASIKILGGLDSQMIPPKWLSLEDIHLGDVFEAKIVDIDVFRRVIQLEPLRRIHVAEEGLVH